MKRVKAASCCFSSQPLHPTGEKTWRGGVGRAQGCWGHSTNSLMHTHTQKHSLGITSAVPLHPPHPSTQPLDPSSSSSSCPGSKHLCLPDLVPLHSRSGPPAADGRFLSRIKSPDGSHSVMIYTALLYTQPAASSSSSC